eukprot:TCONS_00049349-protein
MERIDNDSSVTKSGSSDQNLNNTLCAICGQYINLLSKNPGEYCKCEECDAFFVTQNDRSMHQQKGIRYKCGACQKLFACKSAVRIHTPTHKTSPTNVNLSVSNSGVCFECKDCGVSFTTKHSLAIHQNNGIEYQCTVCQKLFACKSAVLIHAQTHSLFHHHVESKETLSYNQTSPKFDADQCGVCKKSFSSEHRLRHHLKTHSKVLTSCDKCGKGFSLEEFLDHNKNCSKKKFVLKCKICERFFFELSALNKHMNIHTKPFSCSKCARSFARKKALERHQRTRKCLFKCKECEKNFSNTDDFIKHKRTHYKFECKDCGKLYNSKRNLLDHENSHKGIKAYPCETCGKSFSTSGSLATHKKMHGPLLFNCEECGKCFAHKHSLERHVFLHKDIKSFKCETCGKGFKSKTNLNGHNKTVKCKSKEGNHAVWLLI